VRDYTDLNALLCLMDVLIPIVVLVFFVLRPPSGPWDG